MMLRSNFGPYVVCTLLFAAGCGGTDDEAKAGTGGSPGGGGTSGKGGTSSTGGSSGSAGSGGSATGGTAGSSVGGSGGSGGAPTPSPGCPSNITSDPTIQQVLPQQTVDTSMPAMTGKLISVAAGGDLQQAIDTAQPGDVIELAAGAEFKGTISLPNKTGNDWIVIRSSQAASLPEGVRVSPADAPKMARILAPAGIPAVTTEAGAHHYRFIGIEFAAAAYSYNLINLDPGSSNAADFPHHIVADRCYLHGHPTKGTRRGFLMNSAHTALINSYLTDFKEDGADSQAAGAWNGPGPFKIINNYLAGAGENVMFGGATPSVAGTVSSDIEICGNHFVKPFTWKVGHPSYEGTPWSVKNLFELKNAQRVLVAGNVLENNWAHAQTGFAVQLTVRGELGKAPWATVQDVTFSYNIIRHTGSGFNMFGHDAPISEPTVRIVISQNLIYDIDRTVYGGDGRTFQIVGDGNPPLTGALFDHNTALHTNSGGTFMTHGDSGVSVKGLIFHNNIVTRGAYGYFGSGSSEGIPSIQKYAPDAVVTSNAIVGTDSGAKYPDGNIFLDGLSDVGFVDAANGDYTLQASSPLAKKGTDGQDLGVDMQALQAATSGAVTP